jgi:hypothetical protein
MIKQDGFLHRVVAIGLTVGVLVLAGAGDAGAEGRFGFFGGLNFANMGGDMDHIGNGLAADLADQFGGSWSASKGSKTGIGFGGYYYLSLSPTLGMQIEGQYMNRGVAFDLTGPGESGEARLKLNYFELPVLLRLSPGPGMDGRLVFLAGPVFGFNSTTDLEVKAGGSSTTTDVSDQFKSTTFGALIGVGFNVAMGETSAFLVQARYYLGLANALDDLDLSSKSGDFGFFAGLEFGLGGR